MILKTIFSWPLHLGALGWLFMLFIWFPFIALVVFILKRKLDLPLKKKRRIIVGSAIVLFLIPTADAFVESVRFNWLCNSQAGMFVYRSVDGVEGFLTDSTGVASLSLYEGFAYMEYYDSVGRVYKYELKDSKKKTVPAFISSQEEYVEWLKKEFSNDQEVKERVYEIQSNYKHYSEHSTNGNAIAVYKQRIVDLNNNEILGQVINFRFYGGILDRKIMGWMGVSSKGCFNKTERIYSWDFIPEVIKPKKFNF